jgi:NADH-quinone oxidoreductase subunit L
MTRAVSLTFFGTYKGHGEPHESPNVMTYPLIALAFFSVVAGWINIPGVTHWFTDGLAARFLAPGDHHAESLNYGLAAIGTLAAVGGIVIGYLLWFADKDTQKERDKFRIPVLYPLLEHKYYIDDFYMDGIIRPVRGPVARAVDWFNGHVIDLVINGAGWVATKLAKVVYWVDQRGVDGAINASAAAAGGTGGLVRLLQTGRVQQYAFLIVAGTVVLVAGFVIF